LAERNLPADRARACCLAAGGFDISDIRDEADQSFEAMREVVTIGERAQLPVQNTHAGDRRRLAQGVRGAYAFLSFSGYNAYATATVTATGHVLIHGRDA
jgi:hypothetical protein